MPSYSLSSIVNAASGEAGAVAPNTFISIYGRDLAFVTRALEASDLSAGRIPYTLPGTGVRVLVANIQASLLFVSPGQVNLLVPSNLMPGPADVIVTVEGRAGPAVRLDLLSAAPALFLQAPETAAATRADGSLVSGDSPAAPGEVVVLYATGLGPTTPRYLPGEITRVAARLEDMAGFQVLIDGVLLPKENVLYAGLAPGFAGLYQVNLRLPAHAPANPEVRLVAAGRTSPARVKLPVRGGGVPESQPSR